MTVTKLINMKSIINTNVKCYVYIYKKNVNRKEHSISEGKYNATDIFIYYNDEQLKLDAVNVIKMFKTQEIVKLYNRYFCSNVF